jgi:hypothetical protein
LFAKADDVEFIKTFPPPPDPPAGHVVLHVPPRQICVEVMVMKVEVWVTFNVPVTFIGSSKRYFAGLLESTGTVVHTVAWAIPARKMIDITEPINNSFFIERIVCL